MARIYLAGSYKRRAELFERAKDLVQAGHTVTSRWLKGNDDLSKEEQIETDLVDLLSADTILSFTSPEGEYNTGGRHVELGYALALNDRGDTRRLLLVGWPENIFHYAPDVEHCPTFAAALDTLEPVTGATVLRDARQKASTL